MNGPSFFRIARWLLLVAAAGALAVVADACGGKVVVDKAASGQGGQGGHGGGPSDQCGDFGPADPNGPCKTDGAQCFYGDTSCAQSWTCKSGNWSEGTGCFESSAIAGGG